VLAAVKTVEVGDAVDAEQHSLADGVNDTFRAMNHTCLFPRE
jgi:hypothetical protein